MATGQTLPKIEGSNSGGLGDISALINILNSFLGGGKQTQTTSTGGGTSTTTGTPGTTIRTADPGTSVTSGTPTTTTRASDPSTSVTSGTPGTSTTTTSSSKNINTKGVDAQLENIDKLLATLLEDVNPDNIDMVIQDILNKAKTAFGPAIAESKGSGIRSYSDSVRFQLANDAMAKAAVEAAKIKLDNKTKADTLAIDAASRKLDIISRLAVDGATTTGTNTTTTIPGTNTTITTPGRDTTTVIPGVNTTTTTPGRDTTTTLPGESRTFTPPRDTVTQTRTGATPGGTGVGGALAAAMLWNQLGKGGSGIPGLSFIKDLFSSNSGSLSSNASSFEDFPDMSGDSSSLGPGASTTLGETPSSTEAQDSLFDDISSSPDGSITTSELVGPVPTDVAGVSAEAQDVVDEIPDLFEELGVTLDDVVGTESTTTAIENVLTQSTSGDAAIDIGNSLVDTPAYDLAKIAGMETANAAAEAAEAARVGLGTADVFGYSSEISDATDYIDTITSTDGTDLFVDPENLGAGGSEVIPEVTSLSADVAEVMPDVFDSAGAMGGEAATTLADYDFGSLVSQGGEGAFAAAEVAGEVAAGAANSVPWFAIANLATRTLTDESIIGGPGSAFDISDFFEQCFITTAATKGGETDKGYTLEVLREFRNTYMQETPERQSELIDYYFLAPYVVKRISEREDSEDTWAAIRSKYLDPAVYAFKKGQPEVTYKLYKEMMKLAQQFVGLASPTQKVS